jgi:predicted dehydrogenase
MIKVAIIGCGYAGARFLRTFLIRKKLHSDVEVSAVCDKNMDRLNLPKKLGINVYTDLSKMFENKKYDIVVVATNEAWRFEVLSALTAYKKHFTKIISEKLLTENMDQANNLLSAYTDNEISVHFIERCSDIVVQLYHWITENKLSVRRANFFWGKNRLYDHRPTIGVISEISHPIDMILFLANAFIYSEFEIIRGNYLFSNFSYPGKNYLETINVNIKFGEKLFVNGNSSFLWNERDRRINLFLTKDGEERISYIANIKFDSPFWDNDKCDIFEIDTKSSLSVPLKKFTVNVENINSDLKHILKMYSFVNKNIEEVLKNNILEDPFIAKLSQAHFVQKIVTEILSDATKHGIYVPCFYDLEPNKETANKYDEDLFNLISYGSKIQDLD